MYNKENKYYPVVIPVERPIIIFACTYLPDLDIHFLFYHNYFVCDKAVKPVPLE